MKHAPAWLLLLVVLAWFWPVPLGARATSPTIDTHALPLSSWFADALDQRRVPEWNSLDGTGTPALASSEIAAYYPPHQIAYRLLTPARAWTLLLVLHTLAAAVFGRLCARGFGLGPWGSLLVGIVFAGQGFFMTHADRSWAASTACWLPLATWAAWRWLQSGSIGSLLGLAGVLAIQATAGHFQLAFMTVLTLVGLSIGQRLVTRSKWPTVLFRAAGIALAVLVAASLAAAQLVPSAELARVGDTRARDVTFLGSHSIPPWHLLVGQLAPTLIHSDPLWEASAWAPWQASPRETLGYVGLLTFGLAILGLAAWKTDRRVRLWGLLLLVALVLGLGQNVPGFHAICRWPGFDWFPAPGRWSVVGGLWWAMLAGRGLEHLDSPRLGTWCRAFSITAFLALATATAGVVSAAADTEAFFERPGKSAHPVLIQAGYTTTELTTRSLTPATEFSRLLSTGLVIPCLFFAALAALSLAQGPLRTLARRPGLVVLLVAIDLGGTAMLLRPLEFTWEPYDPANSSTLLKRLAKHPGSRVISPLGRLPMAAGLAPFSNPSLPDIELDWIARAHPRAPAVYGWPQDWWPLPPPSRRDTLGVLLARMPSRQNENDLTAMQWTGTRRLIVDSFSPGPPSTSTLQAAGAIEDSSLAQLHHGPRVARLPSSALYSIWTLAPDRPSARAWFVPLDSLTTALPEAGTDPSLERQPPPVRRGVLDPPRPIETLVDRGEQLEVVLRCDQPGAVVLADQVYPGWKATRTISGSSPERADIEIAWGRWRMVRIPRPGDWTVRFQFASPSHQLGRQISVLALVVWLAAIGLHWWSRRQPVEPIHAGNTPEVQSERDSPTGPTPSSIQETG